MILVYQAPLARATLCIVRDMETVALTLLMLALHCSGLSCRALMHRALVKVRLNFRPMDVVKWSVSGVEA